MPKKTFKLDPNERHAVWNGIRVGLSCPDFTTQDREVVGPIAAQLLVERDLKGVPAHYSTRRMKFRSSDDERRLMAQALEFAQGNDPHEMLEAFDLALIPQLVRVLRQR